MQNSVNVEYLCLIQLELQTDLVLTSIDKREITTREQWSNHRHLFQCHPSLLKKLEYKEA